ncbi:hypothetical protein Tcan_10416 [Toxocara canis]|uniref:Uncharacterized protein n=1 Tax=Toxocara canis TaxID=6265 RepID=A0A0B2VGG1_TOXCA|nr:hypothetical protein Tcan_10416 [Toxocara canis]
MMRLKRRMVDMKSACSHRHVNTYHKNQSNVMVRAAIRKDDCLRKKLMSGGIAKETKLTAIEKRRRMIEAGRKYATLNGIALHSNAISKQPTHFKEGNVELVAPSALANQTQALGGLKDMVQVEKELECEPKSVRKSVLQHKPPHFLHLMPPCRSSARDSKKNSNLANKQFSLNVPFEKDVRSLHDIINGKPIAGIIERPSYCRARERPSLFPNGINPLDEASTARYHRLPQSQRSPKELKTFSAFVRPLACATNASPSQTPSSSNVKLTCKKTPKSVHFSDKITFRSPPLSCLEKLPQLPEVLNLNVSDSELDAQLSELPSGIISRLNDALQRIHTERDSELDAQLSELPSGIISRLNDALQRIHTERSARNSERGDRLGSEESTPTEEGSAECLARKRGRPKRQTRSVKADELYPWSAVKVGNVAEEERSCDPTRRITRSTGIAQARPSVLPRSTKSHRALCAHRIQSDTQLLQCSGNSSANLNKS